MTLIVLQKLQKAAKNESEERALVDCKPCDREILYDFSFFCRHFSICSDFDFY